jgi:DUF4097 and DUF4098 domain-containing protein YvlB
MKHSISAVVLALALGLGGVVHASDLDKVNGDVHVTSGQSVGDVSTVNGDVRVDGKATVDKAETVNGSITLDDHATATSLETVNGSITLGVAARVNGAVTAVNGSIDLDQGAEVDGRASNVNGGIHLKAALVAGGLKTVDGDIDVGAVSRVEGGILVYKPGGWFNIGMNRQRTPRIVIGPGAVVKGTLEFRRDVELYVSDRAQIGPVKGATPQKFSGDQP